MSIPAVSLYYQNVRKRSQSKTELYNKTKMKWQRDEAKHSFTFSSTQHSAIRNLVNLVALNQMTCFSPTHSRRLKVRAFNKGSALNQIKLSFYKTVLSVFNLGAFYLSNRII